jgi:tungstate transport system substrate-binding protein
MKILRVSILLVAVSLLFQSTAPAGSSHGKLLLATTTSLRDSGLLDDLLPVFAAQSRIQVQLVAVGTGAALRMGSEGNADVLITHAPASEVGLVESGALASRTEIMENYFVLAGAPEDPAKLGDAPSVVDAFRRLAAAPAPYVSRGDDSGTHKKEVALLEAAGLDPQAGWKGFASTGSGMGLTLQIAGERRAYVLSDIGTYLAFRERIGLVVLSKPEPSLRNVYSVLQINGERFPGRIRTENAKALEAFLVSNEAPQRIARFGLERFGQPLFTPLLLETPSSND